MSYRPITDVWLLTRPKVKYYGAFPSGFLHRARALLGVGRDDAVLHVCAGRVRDYPYKGFGPNDKTLDLDPSCAPDFLQDARLPFPMRSPFDSSTHPAVYAVEPWDAILIDRPYTREDAAHYAPGPDVFPELGLLVRNALAVLKVGGKVGTLDYQWPSVPVNAREVAVVAVGTGRKARARWFVVLEKLS